MSYNIVNYYLLGNLKPMRYCNSKYFNLKNKKFNVDNNVLINTEFKINDCKRFILRSAKID